MDMAFSNNGWCACGDTIELPSAVVCSSCALFIQYIQEDFYDMTGGVIMQAVKMFNGDYDKARDTIETIYSHKRVNTTEEDDEIHETLQSKPSRKPILQAKEPTKLREKYVRTGTGQRIRLTLEIDADFYNELEFDLSRSEEYEPEFEMREDELGYLNEMLDVALLSKDIEWAKELHAQIKCVREGA